MGNTAEPIRVLIVDDHFVVRLGISSMINTEPGMRVIAEAEDGQQALDQFRRLKPDITLMDLRMPGMSGIETTTAVLKEFPNAHIIILTTYDGDEDIYKAIQAGARAYLLKNMASQDMIKAIRAVHEGKVHLPETVAHRLAERLYKADLTGRELEVLELIAKGMGNKEIGNHLNIAEGTVKNHIRIILSKLGAHDRTQALTIALQRGILHLN